MTNHFHLLVQLQRPADLTSWLAGMLRAYVHFFNRRCGFLGHLWQGRFKRNRWFVVPTGHSVRSRWRSSCNDFMAEPFSDDVAGHPNRTEKRLIFRHNAIPRNDFCTVIKIAPSSSSCHRREQLAKALGHGRVGQDGVAERGVRQAGRHRDLDSGQQLAGFGSECGEAEDAVAGFLDERLEEPSCLGNRPGPQDAVHGDLGQAVLHAPLAGLTFAQPDPGQLRIGEQAERHLAAGRHAIPAGKVIEQHSKVVMTNVREVRAPGAVAPRPDVLGCRLQPLIDPDVPVLVGLDARLVEADAVGVRACVPRQQAGESPRSSRAP